MFWGNILWFPPLGLFFFLFSFFFFFIYDRIISQPEHKILLSENVLRTVWNLSSVAMRVIIDSVRITLFDTCILLCVILS